MNIKQKKIIDLLNILFDLNININKDVIVGHNLNKYNYKTLELYQKISKIKNNIFVGNTAYLHNCIELFLDKKTLNSIKINEEIEIFYSFLGVAPDKNKVKFLKKFNDFYEDYLINETHDLLSQKKINVVFVNILENPIVYNYFNILYKKRNKLSTEELIKYFDLFMLDYRELNVDRSVDVYTRLLQIEEKLQTNKYAQHIYNK